MRSDHRSSLPLASILLALVLAGTAGCGLFGQRRELPPPPPAPTPQPTTTPEAYLLLKLDERRLYVVENDVKQPPEGYRVAIGQPKWPTPMGRFQVNEMVENPDFLMFD